MISSMPWKEAGIIEKYGSGIKRVRQALETAGTAPPRFETIGNFFKVTLFPKSGGDSGGEKTVLAHIQNNPGQNTK